MDSHWLGLQPDANTNQPPNQTPIQKLEHIAFQQSHTLNPRCILTRWIQHHCFPSLIDYMTDPVNWEWNTEIISQPSSIPTPSWGDDLKASDCEAYSDPDDSFTQSPLTWSPEPPQPIPLDIDDHRDRLPIPDPAFSSNRTEAKGTGPTPVTGAVKPSIWTTPCSYGFFDHESSSDDEADDDGSPTP
jgi:hypothetical protein